MRGRRFPLWLALGVVLAVALLAGGGAFSSAPPTAAQRAVAIESGIRCPTCEDLSVANSSAPTAVTIRATVRKLIAEGRTDRQVTDFLTSRYGSSIALVPPASGWTLLVWLLPLGGGAVAVAVLARVLVRRRRAAFVDPEVLAAADVAAAGASAAVLAERRTFLERSLADAEAEHRAGDLSDGDYELLRRRDSARLAALESLAAGPAVATSGVAPEEEGTPAPTTPPTPRARPRRQRLLLGGAVTAFGAAVVLLVALYAANRLPGQTVSGSIDLNRQQQIARSLAQAATLENDHQPGPAAQLYQQVLGEDPTNEVALAQLGWLEFQTGQQGGSASLMSDGRAKLDQAVRLAPGDYAARLYLGTVLFQQDHDARGAVAQYQRFLAAGPPPSVLAQAAPIVRQAYQAAGVAVPPGLPAG